MAQKELCLQLHALAYNLGMCHQAAELPDEVASWSQTSLQTRLSKIGARVVRHVCAITFQLAEVAIPLDLFNRILAAIHLLRPSPAPSWQLISTVLHAIDPKDTNVTAARYPGAPETMVEARLRAAAPPPNVQDHAARATAAASAATMAVSATIAHAR